MDLIPYLPALGAALLYSVQFTFTQYYRRECGGSLFATFLHTAGYNAVGFLVLFCIAGFRIRFTPLSFLFAALCIGAETIHVVIGLPVALADVIQALIVLSVLVVDAAVHRKEA